MQYNLKSIKYFWLLVCCACFAFGAFCGSRTTTAVIYPEEAFDVIKTVSHVNVRNQSFELIASFPDEDVAYYRRVDNIPMLSVGDEVCIYTGSKAVVTDVSIHGFTIRTTDITIGDSGTVIRNTDAEQIGYVSQIVGEDLVYCVWS